MTVKCILHTQTGLCVNRIEDPFDDFVPLEGYSVAPDNTGEIYWYWDGDNWNNPYDNYYNAFLGESPFASTPPIEDESDRLATTFYVRQKVEDFIYNVWTQNGILDGGSFTDPAPVLILDAGYFDDTGFNLETDYISPVFDDTGGNLASDITASTY